MEAGTTFTAFVADALREALARRRPDGRPPSPVRLKTYGRKGLNDGVDLDDSAALLDRMDGR